MTNDNHTRRIAEAQVIDASLTLVKAAGWTIEKDATIALPDDFWNYLYVPEASVLLVPTTSDPRTLRATVSTGVRAARSDALVLSVMRSADGLPQMSALVCQWSMLGAHWYGPHLPWVAPDGGIWLVPDHRAPIDAQPSFCLGGDALDHRQAPFSNQIDHRRGLATARDLIRHAMEG
ncbi:hypothetical protein ACFSC3_18730 [Sphingomonas floccifaciens]|uniref:Amine oxidase domain-containing protein n=1 Tax=Sphingomonas floccifaciens TaxID=1844115 RepID=A0ABW4NJA7_9SPHN